MKWSDVISNKQTYPDDAKFTLNGEEVSFGELRRQNAESQGELAQQLQTRQNELDARTTQMDTAVSRLAAVLSNASKVTGISEEDLIAGRIPAEKRQAVAAATASTMINGVPLAEDPLYKPLFETAIVPMQNDMKTVKQALGQSITTYLNDRSRLAYLEFMQFTDKPKDFKMNYKDALQAAVNKGYKDEVGAPDVSRVLNEAMGPVVQAAQGEDRYKAGIEEGRKQAHKDFVAQLGAPQQGAGGIQLENAPENKPGKAPTIKEQLEKAMNDPAIVGTMFGGLPN